MFPGSLFTLWRKADLMFLFGRKGEDNSRSHALLLFHQLKESSRLFATRRHLAAAIELADATHRATHPQSPLALRWVFRGRRGLVSLLLAAMALLASYLSARAAAKIHPMVALRWK
ncbi:MAG TPA: hypothetical protein VGG97_25020 [Bryobacteraceae bacterium]